VSGDIVPLLRNAVEAWANDAADEIERLRAAGDAMANSRVRSQFVKAAKAWQEARREI
jgi:hypothetical protein